MDVTVCIQYTVYSISLFWLHHNHSTGLKMMIDNVPVCCHVSLAQSSQVWTHHQQVHTHTLPSRRFRWQETLKVASFTSQGFLSFSMTWIGEWRFTVVLEDTQPSELPLEHTAAKFKLLYLRISSQNEYMANHEFFLLQIITHTNSF